MEFKGIDISHWNGEIDFQKVKNSGINFVIIKCGGSDAKTRYKDKKFEEYYAKAKAVGLNVGAYYFVGKNFGENDNYIYDAYHFMSLLENKEFEMPIFFDIESTSMANKTSVTQGALTACRMLESYGYFVGIYASDISGFKDRLVDRLLPSICHWVARYGSKPSYVKTYGLWQYSSTGKVDGIKGNVDMDISYVNYPMVIKKHNMNGFG